MPKHTSSAKVVDGSLVLSLPDAVTPVVMRLSLEEAKSAAFTVLEKKGQHVLTVQFSDTESREIAPFAEKEQAVAALMAASAALEKGSRVIGVGSANDNGASIPVKGVAKWAGALGVLVLLVWVISTMVSGLPQAPLPPDADRRGASNTAANTTAGGTRAPFSNPREVTGQAVSADDFLSRGQ